MKKTKIVVPALAVLLLSTAASVSGTVAWFSMNTSINVSGMTVKTKVSSNLQIAETNAEANYSNDDLEQARAAYLEPASTVNGQNYFYTTDADGSGVAKEKGAEGATTYIAYNESANTGSANAGKTKHDAAFCTAYGFNDPAADAGSGVNDTMCFAYVDYSFYLKGTAASANQSIYMSKCEMAYKGAGQGMFGALEAGWAWRVCLFSVATSANTTVADGDAAVSANNKTIMKFAASANHTANYAVSSASSTLAAVDNANQPAAVTGALTAGTPVYYKVIVRLWLEGEDTTCTNATYATLTGDWSLNVDFNLDGDASTKAVSAITTVA